jgi:MFS family permease
MQMSFAGGFFLAGLLNALVGPLGWRWVFAAGAIPAALALLVGDGYRNRIVGSPLARHARPVLRMTRL